MDLKQKWIDYKKNFSKKDAIVLALIPVVLIPVYLIGKHYINKGKNK